MYVSKVATLAEDYAAQRTFSGSLNGIYEVIFSQRRCQKHTSTKLWFNAGLIDLTEACYQLDPRRALDKIRYGRTLDGVMQSSDTLPQFPAGNLSKVWISLPGSTGNKHSPENWGCFCRINDVKASGGSYSTILCVLSLCQNSIRKWM